MGNKDVISMVADFLQPAIAERGLILYDIEFVKEGPNWYFRVYIDKDGGVGIEDCEVISRITEKFLDEKDPIAQAYMLEVSSPGLDRPLKKDADFEKYAGHTVDLKLYKAQEKRKHFQGKLDGLSDGIITLIEEDGTRHEFKREDVASCRLSVIL